MVEQVVTAVLQQLGKLLQQSYSGPASHYSIITEAGQVVTAIIQWTSKSLQHHY